MHRVTRALVILGATATLATAGYRSLHSVQDRDVAAAVPTTAQIARVHRRLAARAATAEDILAGLSLQERQMQETIAGLRSQARAYQEEIAVLQAQLGDGVPQVGPSPWHTLTGASGFGNGREHERSRRTRGGDADDR